MAKSFSVLEAKMSAASRARADAQYAALSCRLKRERQKITVAAMKEAREGNLESFESVEALMADLKAKGRRA